MALPSPSSPAARAAGLADADGLGLGQARQARAQRVPGPAALERLGLHGPDGGAQGPARVRRGQVETVEGAAQLGPAGRGPRGPARQAQVLAADGHVARAEDHQQAGGLAEAQRRGLGGRRPDRAGAARRRAARARSGPGRRRSRSGGGPPRRRCGRPPGSARGGCCRRGCARRPMPSWAPRPRPRPAPTSAGGGRWSGRAARAWPAGPIEPLVACHQSARRRSRAVMRRRSSTLRGTSSGIARRRSGCTSSAVAQARQRGWSSPSWAPGDQAAERPPGDRGRRIDPRGDAVDQLGAVTSSAAAWTHSSIRVAGSSDGSAGRQPPSARPAAIAPARRRVDQLGRVALAGREQRRRLGELAALAALGRAGHAAERLVPAEPEDLMARLDAHRVAGREELDRDGLLVGAGRMTRPSRCTKTRSEVVGARCITTAARVSSQPSSNTYS